MSVMICEGCPKGYCLLVIRPDTPVVPSFCPWGEGIAPSKWEQVNDIEKMMAVVSN